MGLNELVEKELRRMVCDSTPGDERLLESTLRYLAKWRSTLIANTIAMRDGTVVQSGPFAGMQYVRQATEGALPPRLLGCYEAELHPYIEAAIAEKFDTVIDIGCAEGYYAVGFARRLPDATIYAYDASKDAQVFCAKLAEINGVSNRVKVRGEFGGDRFAEFANTKTMVFCDIEGGEQQLLDPVRFPALSDLHIIIEVHEYTRPGLTDSLSKSFLPTHHVTRVDPRLNSPELPSWIRGLGHLDQLLAVWEWRIRPTPWLILRPLKFEASTKQRREPAQTSRSKNSALQDRKEASRGSSATRNRRKKQNRAP